MGLSNQLKAFTAFLQNAVLLIAGGVFDLVFSPLSLSALLAWILLFFVIMQLEII